MFQLSLVNKMACMLQACYMLVPCILLDVSDAETIHANALNKHVDVHVPRSFSHDSFM